MKLLLLYLIEFLEVVVNSSSAIFENDPFVIEGHRDFSFGEDEWVAFLLVAEVQLVCTQDVKRNLLLHMSISVKDFGYVKHVIGK